MDSESKGNRNFLILAGFGVLSAALSVLFFVLSLEASALLISLVTSIILIVLMLASWVQVTRVPDLPEDAEVVTFRIRRDGSGNVYFEEIEEHRPRR